MANIIDECITLKDSDHKRMLFILAKMLFEANTYAEFTGFGSSIVDASINYRIKNVPGLPAGSHFLTFQAPLPMNYDDSSFPVNHKVTVKLYSEDATEMVYEKSMDTKDSPVLR